MGNSLLSYYEAIEKASTEMLAAACRGCNWDEVAQARGACAVLIAQLKNAAQAQRARRGLEAKEKSRIMRRILLNDAEIRHLARHTHQRSPTTCSARAAAIRQRQRAAPLDRTR